MRDNVGNHFKKDVMAVLMLQEPCSVANNVIYECQRSIRHRSPDVTDTSNATEYDYSAGIYKNASTEEKSIVRKPKNVRELLQIEANEWLKGTELPKRRLSV